MSLGEGDKLCEVVVDLLIQPLRSVFQLCIVSGIDGEILPPPFLLDASFVVRSPVMRVSSSSSIICTPVSPPRSVPARSPSLTYPCPIHPKSCKT